MTKKVKISFLVLLCGIIVIQTHINQMDQQELKKHAVFSSLTSKKEQVAETMGKVEHKKNQNTENENMAHVVSDNSTTEMNLQVEGNLEKDRHKRNQWTREMLNEIGGKEVFRIDNDEIHTIYGYTSQRKGYMTVNHHKVNVQISFSYLEEKNKTMIKIGFPIINSSY